MGFSIATGAITTMCCDKMSHGSWGAAVFNAVEVTTNTAASANLVGVPVGYLMTAQK